MTGTKIAPRLPTATTRTRTNATKNNRAMKPSHSPRISLSALLEGSLVTLLVSCFVAAVAVLLVLLVMLALLFLFCCLRFARRCWHLLSAVAVGDTAIAFAVLVAICVTAAGCCDLVMFRARPTNIPIMEDCCRYCSLLFPFLGKRTFVKI